MDFLQLSGKTILVFGVANRKSVACHIGRVLDEAGAAVVYVVRSDERAASSRPSCSAPDAEIHVCDVEHQEQIDRLRDEVGQRHPTLARPGPLDRLCRLWRRRPSRFTRRPRRRSCGPSTSPAIRWWRWPTPFASLLDRRRLGRDDLDLDHADGQRELRLHGADQGGLDSSLVFLAKSFSQFSEVRFNAVAPGLLKTSASAGIPGYVESLSLRRTGHAPQAGRANRRSRQRRRLPAQPALQRHQRPAARGRRRHGDQLFRPRDRPPRGRRSETRGDQSKPKHEARRG